MKSKYGTLHEKIRNDIAAKIAPQEIARKHGIASASIYAVIKRALGDKPNNGSFVKFTATDTQELEVRIGAMSVRVARGDVESLRMLAQLAKELV